MECADPRTQETQRKRNDRRALCSQGGVHRVAHSWVRQPILDGHDWQNLLQDYESPLEHRPPLADIGLLQS